MFSEEMLGGGMIVLLALLSMLGLEIADRRAARAERRKPASGAQPRQGDRN